MRFPGWKNRCWGRPRRVAIAVLAAIGLALASTWMPVPPFVFDDAAILLTVGAAVAWGLGPAISAAVVSVTAAGVLQAPAGFRAIGVEAALDLALMLGIAVLVQRLVARARDAQTAAEHAARRERHVREARERMVATVAHDLATPLTAVSGTLQFARRFGLTRDHERGRVLQRLETAAARATSLVKTLADTQDLGGIRPDRVSRISLREVVCPIVEMMDQVSEQHPVVLDAGPADVIIDADAERLQRVFENLLTNAIKYSPAGGPIDVSIGKDNHCAVVIVRDRGMGIAPDVRSRVFDFSYRSPEASATSDGQGFGLSIAAHIVTGHGGTIEAHDAEGGGTALIVSLPLAYAARSAAAVAQSRV